VIFVIGRMTGVLFAVPPADPLRHSGLFLVARFRALLSAPRAVAAKGFGVEKL
jgi:heme/copper-type cytochrome/quinol oxidase subunit 1